MSRTPQQPPGILDQLEGVLPRTFRNQWYTELRDHYPDSMQMPVPIVRNLVEKYEAALRLLEKHLEESQ